MYMIFDLVELWQKHKLHIYTDSCIDTGVININNSLSCCKKNDFGYN